MKFALINPITFSYPPLGLGYLAGILEQLKDEVLIIDELFQGWEEKILSFQPDIIGVSLFSATASEGIKVMKRCKEISKAEIIVGGAHATLLTEHLLNKYQEIAFVVFGEGEHTIRELSAFFKGKQALEEIKGIAYRRKDEIIINQPRPCEENLDSLPYFPWHLLDINRYTKAPIVASRGCPYHCIFCAVHLLQGKKWRRRSAKNIADEIEQVNRKYKFTHFELIGDNLLLNRTWVMEICDEIINRQLEISWFFTGARADLVDKEILEKLKEAGCYAIWFGIESGNQKILKNLKKGETLSQIRKAVKLAQEVGLQVVGHFLIGSPGETEKTIQETVNFAFELNLDDFYFNLLIPYPGTEVYQWVLQNGRFLLRDVDDYPSHLPAEEQIKIVFDTSDFPAKKRLESYRWALNQKKLFLIRKHVKSGMITKRIYLSL